MSEAAKQREFNLPSTCSMGNLETDADKFFKSYRKKSDHEAPLLIDMSECNYVGLCSLFWIVALLDNRCTSGLATTILLPRAEKVRAFLAVWDFPDAIEKATNRLFYSFLNMADRNLFRSESQGDNYFKIYENSRIKIDGEEKDLLSSKFFAVHSLLTDSDDRPDLLPEKQNERWRTSQVLAVLNNHLKRNSELISSHIVHEAIMNALMHPNATLIQTASFFDRPQHYSLRNSTKKGISSWRLFFKTLNAQRFSDEPSAGKRIWECLSHKMKKIINESPKSTPVRKEVGQAFTVALNKVLERVDFFRSNYFAKDILTPEATLLLRRSPTSINETDIVRYNRQLLDASFSDSIAPCSQGHLTIVWWDNGESMIKTLGDAVATGKGGRSVDTSDMRRQFRLTVENEDGEKSEQSLVWSDITPTATSAPEVLLLAALFPGITRDTKKGSLSHTDVRESEEDEETRRYYGYAGMGLHILLNQTLDVFGGTLAMRTGNYFLNIKRAARNEEAAHYFAKVRKYGDWQRPFKGNMLTVRLPLK